MLWPLEQELWARRGDADFVFQYLAGDQSFEEGRLKALEDIIGKEELDRVREDSRKLTVTLYEWFKKVLAMKGKWCPNGKCDGKDCENCVVRWIKSRESVSL